MELVGYLSLVVLGFVLSVIGGGGSLLSMPILVYLFSLDIVTASSYSLFIVGTSSLIGALQKISEDGADFSAAFAFACSSAVTIFTTRRWIMPTIPELWVFNEFLFTKRDFILGIFSLIVIASSLATLLRPVYPSAGHGKRRLKVLLPVSLPTGLIAGLVGVGGGVIILPALIIFARLPFKIAVGTTLLVISCNSMLGFFTDVTIGNVDWIFLLLVTALTSVGMFFGNHYHAKIPVNFVRLMFGWILLVIAIGIIARELVM
jgi:uncharacterized protein